MSCRYTPIDEAGPVHLSVSIEARSGAVIFHDDADVELTRMQPNGPECPPTFYSAFVVAHPRDGLVITP